VSKFTDALGWTPGLEDRAEGLFFRDFDASTVVPSWNNQVYSVRIVDKDGNLIPDDFGFDLGLGGPLTGTGNPADDGVRMGVSIEIMRVAKDNSYATVHVVPAPAP
jgi:immune inhibitor A